LACQLKTEQRGIRAALPEEPHVTSVSPLAPKLATQCEYNDSTRFGRPAPLLFDNGENVSGPATTPPPGNWPRLGCRTAAKKRV